MAEVFLTKEAYKELEERLAYLKSEGRVAVAEKISVARSFGDISEKIEENLRNAQIITKAKVDTSKVSVGSTVEVLDMEYDEKMTLKIMGSIESDPTIGQISNESPTGKALIGRSKGEVVDVVTPAGVLKYKILSISY